MPQLTLVPAREALCRLLEGNRRYLEREQGMGEVSPALRRRLAREGQSPYAVVVTCSDSRVPPEYIFSAGLGELFTIRVAGNVVDGQQLGSVEYAVEHLGCRLVLVLGHSGCGAVEAALSGGGSGYVRLITDAVCAAVGEETDPLRATERNVRRGVQAMEQSDCLRHMVQEEGLEILGAIYDLESGGVRLLPEFVLEAGHGELV